MKKSIVVLFAILFCNYVKAQNFQGIAEYEFKKQLNLEKMENIKVGSEDLVDNKLFQEALSKAMIKRYKLEFSATESIFNEIKELEKPNPKTAGVFVSVSFNKGVFYKNLKDKSSIEENLSLDQKNFRIQSKLVNYEWKIGSETKKIGNYNCIKAVGVIRVTTEQLDKFNKNKSNKKSISGFLDTPEPKDEVVTAWFTPEIPVGNGPDKYDGLPGLILELTTKKNIFICSKIIINPTKKIVIDAPTNGKLVTYLEYQSREDALIKKMGNEDGVIIHEIKN